MRSSESENDEYNHYNDCWNAIPIPISNPLDTGQKQQQQSITDQKQITKSPLANIFNIETYKINFPPFPIDEKESDNSLSNHSNNAVELTGNDNSGLFQKIEDKKKKTPELIKFEQILNQTIKDDKNKKVEQEYQILLYSNLRRKFFNFQKIIFCKNAFKKVVFLNFYHD